MCWQIWNMKVSCFWMIRANCHIICHRNISTSEVLNKSRMSTLFCSSYSVLLQDLRASCNVDVAGRKGRKGKGKRTKTRELQDEDGDKTP